MSGMSHTLKKRASVGSAGAAEKVRQRVLTKMRNMSPDELFDLAVRAGIYTEDGKLTRPYRNDAEPSACRAEPEILPRRPVFLCRAYLCTSLSQDRVQERGQSVRNTSCTLEHACHKRHNVVYSSV